MTVSTPKRRAERQVDDLVSLYLNDIGEFPLLSRADEVRLAQQIEDGNIARERLTAGTGGAPSEERELRRTVRDGEDAQETFVQSNLRLVVSIAKKYRASGVLLLDLIQDGNLGLIHAVEKFDWRRGFKFSTYATWWIRQAITRSISNTGRTIRLPERAGDSLARLRAARSFLELELGRPATLIELTAELDMPANKVTEALQFEAPLLSLAQTVSADSDVELSGLIEDNAMPSPSDAALLTMLRLDVDTMLGALDERERRIISLRFGFDRGEPRSLQDVGKHFNLTRERIRQIEAIAISKLRQTPYARDRQPAALPGATDAPEVRVLREASDGLGA